MADNALELLELDEEGKLKISAWTLLVPEFKIIVDKDRGQKAGPDHNHKDDWYKESDSQGRKKLYARRRLAFIQLMYGYRSHLRRMDDAPRREQAMKDQGLTEKDFDADMIAAIDRYQIEMKRASRGLKTLRVMEKALDKLDTYLEGLDLMAEDKMGKLKYDAGKVQDSIFKMKITYRSVKEFEEVVMNELLGADSGIRGKAEKGDIEGKRRNFTYDGQMGNAPRPKGQSVASAKTLNWKDAGRKLDELEDRMPDSMRGPDDTDEDEGEQYDSQDDKLRTRVESGLAEIELQEEEEQQDEDY